MCSKDPPDHKVKFDAVKKVLRFDAITVHGHNDVADAAHNYGENQHSGDGIKNLQKVVHVLGWVGLNTVASMVTGSSLHACCPEVVSVSELQ